MHIVYEIWSLIYSWKIMILGIFFLPSLRFFCKGICISALTAHKCTFLGMHTVQGFTLTWVQPPSVITVMITLGWFSWNSFFSKRSTVRWRVVYGTLWPDSEAAHHRNMVLTLLILPWDKTGIFWVWMWSL